jgi:hypothetical protein
MYNSNKNMEAVVIPGLNVAITVAYRQVKGREVDIRMYRLTDDLRDIIQELRILYEQLSPMERGTMDTELRLS